MYIKKHSALTMLSIYYVKSIMVCRLWGSKVSKTALPTLQDYQLLAKMHLID